jgi:glycosyltransferase involved in cell wall biosynthesis
MKIAYITAGAAGMLCGSCMHDNTLVAALQALGHDAILIPTYTPVRTDEENVSQARVFFGGINVYLQEKSAFFRRTPWFLDRLLDWPRLLRWAGRFAVKTRAEELGELTLSMLRGQHGRQRKEIDKLTTWLRDDVRPDVIVLTNVLLSGIVPSLHQALQVPIVATLQGDDIFLESLPEKERHEAKRLITANCERLAGFLATSRYYADFMAQYLALARARIEVVYPGINLKGHGEGSGNAGDAFTIGYFARICPEKGLHVLIDAFRLFKQMPGTSACRLRVGGWMGEHNEPYLEEQLSKLRAANLLDVFEHVDAPDHASKVRFFQGIDVLSVPTTYREPKGLYVLEAWANRVPVVQPRHGTFPELLEITGGGILVEPNNPAGLARALRQVLEHRDEARAMGQRGHDAVQARFHARAMAEATWRVLGEITGRAPARQPDASPAPVHVGLASRSAP